MPACIYLFYPILTQDLFYCNIKYGAFNRTVTRGINLIYTQDGRAQQDGAVAEQERFSLGCHV